MRFSVRSLVPGMEGCGWKVFFLSLSLIRSLLLSPSLSLFHFFYNFKQNRLKKSPQIWEKLIVSRQTLKNFLRTLPEQRTVKIPKS